MQNGNAKFKIYFYFLVVVFSFSFLVFSFSKVDAATLYFSPSAGSYGVGSNFSVSVFVSSVEQTMNAAGGVVSFPQDKMEIISLSKSGSIITFWAQESSFSNTAGTVSFEGVVLPDGFKGGAGRIITLNFRAKTAGTAPLSFLEGSILAHDGLGTSILTGVSAGSYTFVFKEIAPPEEEYVPPPTVPTQAPAPPIVSSLTHPDPDKWYSNNSPEFFWDLTPDITGVRLLLDDKPNSIPTIVYMPPISERKLEDLEDGIWYFHIQLQNQHGWGAITHRKVLVDTKAPEAFEVTINNENDLTNPTPLFVFETTDSLSGIEYYEVILNEESYANVSPQEIKDKPYRPLPLEPGKYKLEVKAYDKAENYISSFAEFEISPIKAPEITKIPERIDVGEILVIEGRGDPEITVKIYIQKIGEEAVLRETKASSDGRFILEYDRILTKGNYVVWTQAKDERGALSLPTEKYSLEVGLPPFLRIGRIVIDYLTIMVTLILLIVGIIALIFYTRYKISTWKRKMRKETKEASQSVDDAFKVMRKEVERQVSMLDKKPGLSKSEKEIRDKLQESLDISERIISKEIKDIEKELK